MMLNTKITIPDEISVTSEGMPTDIIFKLNLSENLHLIGLKLLRFLMKNIESISKLNAGEKPVARAAPKIPIFIG